MRSTDVNGSPFEDDSKENNPGKANNNSGQIDLLSKDSSLDNPGGARELISTVVFPIRELLGDLPDGVSGDLRVEPQSFRPDDEWAIVFRAGLRNAHLTGRVIEVGLGAGANMVDILARHPGIERAWGSDLSASVAQLGAENVLGIDGIPIEKFSPILGASDLLKGFRSLEGEKAPLDYIIGCIPQVRLPENGSKRADQLAHYYSGPVPEGFEEFDHYDMTLNARLLMEASQHLAPSSGRIILNLAGRVPMEVLEKMFAQTGFGELNVLNEAIIHQHRGTRLYDFIKQENELGISFEFFSSPDCSGDRITAKQAQELIDDGLPAFHKLYVIEATNLGLQ